MNGAPHTGRGVHSSDAYAPEVRPIRARLRVSHLAFGALGLFLLFKLVEFLITNPNWQWDVVAKYLFSPLVLEGVQLTLFLTVASTALGLVLGCVAAYMRLSSNPTLQIVANLYIWFVRAIPQLVLLLLIFFFGALVPTLELGFPDTSVYFAIPMNELITRVGASILGLGLYLGAYTSEIIRGGIMAVARGQFEAAHALGMTDSLLMRRIIAPQAIRVIIPAMGNEMITMFKATSLVSVIGAAELLTTTQLIYARTFEVIPLLMVACIWYLFITSLAMVGQAQLEKRFERGHTAKSTAPMRTRNFRRNASKAS